jgi:hypothetical protein
VSDFETELVALLKSDPGLSTLIGTRLWPDEAPAHVQRPLPLPYTIYYLFAQPVIQNLHGDVVVSKPRIQFSTYAEHYGKAKAVTDALKDALTTGEWVVVLEDERAPVESVSGLFRRDLDTRIPNV